VVFVQVLIIQYILGVLRLVGCMLMWNSFYSDLGVLCFVIISGHLYIVFILNNLGCLADAGVIRISICEDVWLFNRNTVMTTHKNKRATHPLHYRMTLAAHLLRYTCLIVIERRIRVARFVTNVNGKDWYHAICPLIGTFFLKKTAQIIIH
jgi:hypothetical protein